MKEQRMTRASSDSLFILSRRQAFDERSSTHHVVYMHLSDGSQLIKSEIGHVYSVAKMLVLTVRDPN